MYKIHVYPIFFPAGPDILPQISFDNILILAPDPLNKGKIIFFCSLKLMLQEYIKQSKTPPEKQKKTTAAGTNIHPDIPPTLLLQYL